MELLLNSSYINCIYQRSSIFNILHFKKGYKLEYNKAARPIVVFLVKGKIKVSWTKKAETTVNEGNMALFNKGSWIYGEALEDGTIITCGLKNNFEFCSDNTFGILKEEICKFGKCTGGGDF